MWKTLRQRLAEYLGRGVARADRPGRGAAAPEAPAPGNGPPAGGARRVDPRMRGRPPREAPRNRAGMPVIDPRDDLAALLGVPEATAEAEAGRPQTIAAPPPAVAGPAPGGNPAANREAPRRNRQGIPVLDPSSNLVHLLTAGRPPGEEAAAEAPPVTREAGPLRDRHGLPRLDAEADLGRLLDPAADGDEQEFARMLAADLRGATPEALRRRKSDSPAPKPSLPLAKRLARYPHPQRQLDLHGCTAAVADRRSADFLQDARRRGLWTVRIIVGRGRHSESGPVLPDVVEDRLVALRRTGGILAYRWDRRDKRRSGAVIVYLEGQGRPPG